MLRFLFGCCARRNVSTSSPCPGWLLPESQSKLHDLVSLTAAAGDSITAMQSVFDSLRIREMKIPKSQTITYIPLIEDPRFTLCLFSVPQGVVMPYHDHPRQHVLLRVLKGQMEISSCDTDDTRGYVPGTQYGVSREETCIVGPDSGTKVVFPTHGNIHQIKAVTDSLFMDFVTPPYSSERAITYFTRDGEVLTAVRERDMNVQMEFCHPLDIVVP